MECKQANWQVLLPLLSAADMLRKDTPWVVYGRMEGQ